MPTTTGFMKVAAGGIRGCYPLLPNTIMIRPRVSIMQVCSLQPRTIGPFRPYSIRSDTTTDQQRVVPQTLHTREISKSEIVMKVVGFICAVGLTIKFFCDYQYCTVKAEELREQRQSLEEWRRENIVKWRQ